MEYIYQSKVNEVIWLDGDSDYIVIAFSERREPAPADFFGLNFFKKRGIRAVIFRSLKNTWWVDEDFYSAKTAAKNFLKSIQYNSLIGYGFSMGAFGVFSTHADFKFSKIVVAGPIASIDPSFDNRWASDYVSLLSSKTNTDFCDVDFKCKLIIFFDPLDHDKRQVSRLRKNNADDIVEIEVKGAGHLVPGYLQKAGLYSELIQQAFSDSFDEKSVATKIWNSRKLNVIYITALIDKCKNSAWRKSKVISYAKDKFAHEPKLIFKIAVIEAQSGKFLEAISEIKKLTSDRPGYLLNEELSSFAYKFIESGGDEREVDGLMNKFQSNEPRPRSAQLWYSRYLRATKKYDLAYASHLMFMKGDSFSAHGHFERGLILEKKKLSFAAAIEYRMALSFVKDFHRATNRLKDLEEKNPMLKSLSVE